MSDKDIDQITLEDGDVVDKETKEIMDELKLDTKDADSKDATEEDTEDKSKDKKEEDSKEEDSDEAEDDAKAEGDKKSEDKKEEDAVEGEEEEGTEEEDKVESKAHRPLKAVPVAKYQGEKKKWKEKESTLLEEIETLKKNPNSTEKETDASLKELAEEYNLDEKFVDKLAANVGSKSKMSDEDRAKLDFLSNKYETEKADTEFNEVIKKLATDYPDEPVKDHMDKIKELAYTEGYLELSTYELWFRHIKPNLPKVKKTSEKSRTVTESSDELDLTDPNLDSTKLNDDQFDKWSDAQASKEKRLDIK